MTSFLSELDKSIAKPGTPCSLSIAIAQLSEEDKKDLNIALADRLRYPGTSIAAVLRKRGISVSGPSVQRHRRKMCTCP